MNDKVLRQHLINLLSGKEAHVSVEDALGGLAVNNRNKRPAENIHSVWENFEHMRIGQEDILKYILDPGWKSPKWPKEYWPDPDDELTDDRWNKSYHLFFDDLNKAIEIANDDSINLTEIIPHTKNHTYLRELLLIADHNAYHTGQIILVRKFLGDWKS